MAAQDIEAAAVEELNTVVFMGSARNKPAKWGGPARLGTRVLRWVENTLGTREKVKHNVTVYDPVEIKLPVMECPFFYYPEDEAPEQMKEIDAVLQAADCFVIVTCEYNHSIPPGLSNLMSHFGGSRYANKASAIVCYSNGQFGGVRGAMQLRAFTGELGCLSVSNICAVPKAHQNFDEEGTPSDPEAWARRIDRCLCQLEFWALAAKDRRMKESMK